MYRSVSPTLNRLNHAQFAWRRLRTGGGAAGEAVEPAADQVAERVAAEREARQQNHIDEHHDAAEPDAEVCAGARLVEESADRVVPEEAEHGHREPEEEPVDVLEDQWQPALAGVAPALGLRTPDDRAGRRRQEERAVVRLAVVVASGPQPERRPDHEERVRERDVQPEQGAQIGRVERRQVAGAALQVVVVGVHRRGDDRVDREHGQGGRRERRREPPAVATRGRAEGPSPDAGRRRRGGDGLGCHQCPVEERGGAEP